MKYLYFFIILWSFTSFAQIPNGYYNTATGTGYILKNQLAVIIDDVNDFNGQNFHDTTVTYGDLWSLYSKSDVRPDGTVWDIYGNCNFIFGTDQDTGTGGNSECDKYNREHTFPQSWYGSGSQHPMKADAFHVLPSDKYINGIRGNLAYAEVASADIVSGNGSKRGTSSIVGPTGSVFEPADEFKGDIARGYFYVAVRYQNEIANWETKNTGGNSMLDGSNTKVFEQWALDMLYNWHINDPVSQKEIERNRAIYLHQNNRNPFIDHPEFVFQIWQNVLSVSQISEDENFKLFSNPAKGFVTIQLNQTGSTNIEIYDVLGKKVLKDVIFNTKTLSIQSLKSGIYILKMTQGQNTVSKKLIKQ